MKLEIPNSEESEKYIEEVFGRYTEIEDAPLEIHGRCVIHIYPTEDTQKDNGELDGFCDAYNCRLDIYDVINKTVYKTYSHDEVNIRIPSRVRIFKDLSTMIIVDEPVRLGYYKSFDVWHLK